MKLLIIGSKGFIGSHCIKYLSARHDVWGCDVYPGYGEERYFSMNPSTSDYYNIFKSGSFDVCINCAGAASVPDSFSNPSRDYELNTYLVFRLLETIRITHSTCRFINLSSAAVYGNPDRLPVSEANTPGPISPYGFHKKQADELCYEYSTFFSIPTITFRLFSAYGPGLRKQIFWDWYFKAQQSEEIILPGTGHETRDYIFIDDIARAIDNVLGSTSGYEVYNLGSGTESPIREAADIFFKKIDYQGRIEFSGVVRSGDPLRWKADINKLKQIGFTPQVELEQGIEKYVTWIRSLP